MSIGPNYQLVKSGQARCDVTIKPTTRVALRNSRARALTPKKLVRGLKLTKTRDDTMVNSSYLHYLGTGLLDKRTMPQVRRWLCVK